MAEGDLASGSPQRTFEDFPTGTVVELGQFSLSEEEIISFASRYDPQPFHVDPEGAAAGPFGGLIASGWHSGASLMRLYVDAMLIGTDSRGSPGIEELRWFRPMRPGEVIRARVTVIDAQRSSTTKNRGTLTLHWEARNDAGDLVMSMRGRGLFGTRSDPDDRAAS